MAVVSGWTSRAYGTWGYIAGFSSGEYVDYPTYVAVRINDGGAVESDSYQYGVLSNHYIDLPVGTPKTGVDRTGVLYSNPGSGEAWVTGGAVSSWVNIAKTGSAQSATVRARACGTTVNGYGPYGADTGYHSVASIPIPALALPGAPASITVTRSSDTSHAISWKAPATALSFTGVQLQVSVNGGGYSTLYNSSVKTSHTAKTAANAYYRYRVRYENARGWGGFATSGIVYNTPAAPSALKISAQSASSIALAWTDNSGYETGFKIERSAAGGAWAQVATVGANVKAWTDSSPNAGTNAYRVRSYQSLNSAYSGTVTSLAVPGKPGTPTITRVSDTSSTVAWAASSPAPTTYNVYRRVNGATADTLIASGLTGRSFTDTTAANSYYYYRVLAVNARASTYSALSAIYRTTPATPTEVSTTVNMSAKTVALSWKDNATSENIGYYIERSTNGTTWTQISTVAQNIVTWTDTDPIMGYSYYRLRAVSSLANGTLLYSAYSTSVQALTALPANPPTDTAVVLNGSTFTVTWKNGAITVERPRTSILVQLTSTTGSLSKTIEVDETTTTFTFADIDMSTSNGHRWQASVISVGVGGNSAPALSIYHYGTTLAVGSLLSLRRLSPVSAALSSSSSFSWNIKNPNAYTTDISVLWGLSPSSITNTAVDYSGVLGSGTASISSHQLTNVPFSSPVYFKLRVTNVANSETVDTEVFTIARVSEPVQGLKVIQDMELATQRYVCRVSWRPKSPTGSRYRIVTNGRDPDIDTSIVHPSDLPAPPDDWITYSFDESSGNEVKITIYSFSILTDPGTNGGTYDLYSYPDVILFQFVPDTLKPPTLLHCELMGDYFKVTFAPPSGGLAYNSGTVDQYYLVDFYIDGVYQPLNPDTPVNHQVKSYNGSLDDPVIEVTRNFVFRSPVDSQLRAVSKDQNGTSILSNPLIIRFDVPDTGVYIYGCPHLLIDRCQLDGPPILANARNSTVIMTDCILGNGEYQVDLGSAIIETNCTRL